MELEERKNKENIFSEFNNKFYIEDLNNQNLSLRSKKISKLLKIKRQNKLEQIKSSLDIINKDQQFQINKFSSSYDRIISYLNSSNTDIQSYILNHLNIYFKYNEPDIKEQKMILKGQFLELLLNLGINFFNNKKEENLIKILWIFINIQIYNEGNGVYLTNLYNQKFLEFYNQCFTQSNSDEIMNEIIFLLYYISQINNDINIIILESKVFESIINFASNENQDLGLKEDIIKLIIACVNISKNCELNEEKINIIYKCLIILKNESTKGNEKIQKPCYQGLYNISKINDKYEFNQTMIKEGIPKLILQNKNKNILLYSLKTLSNILTVPDEDLDKINLEEIITFYNAILNLYIDDDKLVFVILNGIFNITDSKYINLVKSCIIWNQEMIQKIFNKNQEIQLLFLKIIKYIINIGNDRSLKFIYNTKVLEYLIYLLSKSNNDEKIIIKILKLIDNYLSRFNNSDKEIFEYLIVFNKIKDWLNIFHDIINNDENEFLQYIYQKYL